ncbi:MULTISPECIES: organic hydroperoxide resistance protein [unclassified Curtobacterium]|uniref:organic hydroperoxide resistance protein n=1 Tax=unclassified Curtobacterium TaxID=257496 RepID=UPI000DA8A304|nr:MULTISPECIES: organic hydroperoxide resistance protein [unclassified Curtobacterium]PZE28175.1 organic hydroperoxide resistance protein [Curtobacterium sp. MCBD17_028]PZF59482.1 organic hydroperoxide resistance protein [Curtobacterium sp. MCBD17_013]PZF62503.1 organic hydroperoxide resistance protein [Curtobacterium sp. MCBD17_034]PZM40089.1 organic hydroperoxide resistance protein [Curtobacterium sp. MCBD17_031]WIB64158.1 organic hydroperoxide resistance protein [Curtobacterium sp. MCBD17_
MTLDITYTAIAHATGGGRDGHVRSEDDRLDFDTRPPTEMGGNGEGTNPEQLFAAGYSACFLGAYHLVGKRLGVDTTDASVSASVSIGDNGEGGFGLAVELDIYAPNVPADRRQEVAEAAHQVCPYSNATRGNVEVTLSLVD